MTAALAMHPLGPDHLDHVCALEYAANGPRALGRRTIRTALDRAQLGAATDADGQLAHWAAWAPQPDAERLTSWALYTVRQPWLDTLPAQFHTPAALFVQRLAVHPAALWPDSYEASLLDWLTNDHAPDLPIAIWSTEASQPWTPRPDTLDAFGYRLAASSPNAFGDGRPGRLWINPRDQDLEVLIRAATAQ